MEDMKEKKAVMERYAKEVADHDIDRDALMLARGFKIAAETLKADGKEGKAESA